MVNIDINKSHDGLNLSAREAKKLSLSFHTHFPSQLLSLRSTKTGLLSVDQKGLGVE